MLYLCIQQAQLCVIFRDNVLLDCYLCLRDITGENSIKNNFGITFFSHLFPWVLWKARFLMHISMVLLPVANSDCFSQPLSWGFFQLLKHAVIFLKMCLILPFVYTLDTEGLFLVFQKISTDNFLISIPKFAPNIILFYFSLKFPIIVDYQLESLCLKINYFNRF